MTRLAQRMSQLGTENAFKIGPCIAEAEAAGRDVVRCNLGEPDFPLPEHVRAELQRQIELGNTHYVDPQGILPLRRAIARQVSETRGIKVTPERVVVFAGGKPPIGFAQQVYVDPGDEVIYPSPGFPIYESFTRFLDAHPVPLHLSEDRGFSFGAEELEPLLSWRTALVYVNFPANPTGGVADRAQLVEIADVVRRKADDDVRVYSDEVYEHMLFDGARHESIASIPGMEKRTIIVSGVSKSYAWTGGRVGWAVFPTEREAQAFKTLNINCYSCVPGYNQEAAREAIESPKSAQTIATMVAAFQARRDEVIGALRGIEGVRCEVPRGAFYAFPNVAGVCERLGAFDAFAALPEATRERSSPSTLLQMFLLYRHGVATVDRRSFGSLGAEDQHFLRISLATDLPALRLAVERLGRASADRAGFEDFVRQGKHLC